MLIYLDQISPAGFYNNKETHLGRLYFFDQLPSRQTNNLNEYLCKQDQNMVLSAIKSRVDHNYQLFMSTDWIQIAVDQMLDIINTTTAATA
jgi:RNA binding exosome subunit